MTLISGILGVLVGVLVITGLIANAHARHKRCAKSMISFVEAFNLTDMPIVTFRNNGNKYNFLLDTGSTDCHVNKAVVESGQLEYDEMESTKNVFGMEGNPVSVNMINVTLALNDMEFNDAFIVNDLSAAFDSIKRENGVTLHGILGTSFFDKYKYVIDFGKYVAYSKGK